MNDSFFDDDEVHDELDIHAYLFGEPQPRRTKTWEEIYEDELAAELAAEQAELKQQRAVEHVASMTDPALPVSHSNDEPTFDGPKHSNRAGYPADDEPPRCVEEDDASGEMGSETGDTGSRAQSVFSPGVPVSAADLLRADIAPVKWAIDGLITEGLTILAGRPKLGKSLLMMNWCADMAAGETVLGRFTTNPREVMYLALEDTAGRLKQRLTKMFPAKDVPENLHLATQSTFGRMDEGGLERMAIWLKEHPNCRLVVIDTLARFKPREKRANDMYQQDSLLGGRLQKFAFDHGIGVVVVHHLRKAAADDWFDTVTGSTGLTGAADAVMILQRERGKADAILKVGSRDTSELELALTLDQSALRWRCIGDASEIRMSSERQTILDCIRQHGPLKPKGVAEVTGLPVGSVRHLMPKMESDGVLVSDGGTYSCPERAN